MIGSVVPVSCESNVDMTVKQQQTGAIEFPFRLKGDASIDAADAAPRYGRLNDDRAPRFLVPSEQIERVQAMNIGAILFGLAHHIESIRGAVDHRRRGDSDLRHDVVGSKIAAGNGGRAGGRTVSCIQQAHLPELLAFIRVEGEYTVVLRRHEHDIVRNTRQVQPADVEGLCVDIPVDAVGIQLAECRGIDVRGIELCFSGVLAGARRVVTPRGHIDRRMGRKAGRKQHEKEGAANRIDHG
jgi:hypothetical protein